MNEALLVSHLALWCVVIVMGVVIVALARQIGVLHERIAPAGALAVQEGAEVGRPVPRVAAETLDGEPIEIGAPRDDARATLVFFLSPDCPVCKTLLPALRSLARAEAARLEVVLASDGEADACADHGASLLGRAPRPNPRAPQGGLSNRRAAESSPRLELTARGPSP